MHIHLSILHDEMSEVIADGPIEIMKINTASMLSPDAPTIYSKAKTLVDSR